MEYEKLYAQMVEAAEQAIAAIERADYGQAKQILISAEQRCEAEYLEMEERPAGCTGFTAIFGEFARTERLPRRGFQRVKKVRS